MKDTLSLAGIAVLVLLFLAFGVWRWNARMDDCRSLGHGTLYCVVVWGGGR